MILLFRDEMGMFVQKPSYRTSMKIIASVQSKIEGWEVRILYIQGCWYECSVRFNSVATPIMQTHI